MTQAFDDYDLGEEARLVPLINGKEDEDNAIELPTDCSEIFTIGRLATCKLTLDDSGGQQGFWVSGEQAEIFLSQAGEYILRVKSKMAFTFVNEMAQKINVVGEETRYTPPDIPLADGDVLRFGGPAYNADQRYERFVFKFIAPDAVQPDREAHPSARASRRCQCRNCPPC